MRTTDRSPLYVHVPFCVRLCPFCDLPKALLRDRVVDRYLRAVEKELSDVVRGRESLEAGRRAQGDEPRPWRPEAVYFGGGTPTALPEDAFRSLLAAIRARVDLSRMRECTIEVEPGTLEGGKLAAFVAFGGNRVSLGAQSFDAGALRALGRRHDPGATIDDFARARRAGIARVNLDLLFAVPGFGAETLEKDLESAVALGPDHVSLYNLTFEPRTMFERLRREGRLRPHEPESEVSLCRLGWEGLRRAGYVHYEVSNFARPGRPCLYNRHVWRGGDYEAVGPGAAGHRAGRRWRNHRSVDRYLAASERGESLREEVEVLDRDARVREALFLALRQPPGVRTRLMQLRTGADPLVALAEPLARMRSAGHVAIEGGRIRPTEAGVLRADTLAAEILSQREDAETPRARSAELVAPPDAT